MPMDAYRKVVINAVRSETDGVKTFVLAYDDGGVIPYVAGQFITLVFTHHGKEERRSYSISSCAANNEPLAFTVKRLDNGAYSRLLTDKAMVGDILNTAGVAGLFVLPQNISEYRQVYFFAAGIGITPVISLVKTLLLTQPRISIVLVYSNRSKDDVVFYESLQALAAQYPERFVMELLMSTAFNLQRARLNKDLLPQLADEYARTAKDKMLFYVCSPYDYMRMAIYALEEYGIKDEQIRKENFNTNNRQVVKSQPPDTAMHTVNIVLGGKTYRLPVQYPESILMAAKKQRLPLPYSCEAGRCGSCAAHCTSGSIWLSYNEVLMDADLERGMVLTCVGYPIGGDATIEL